MLVKLQINLVGLDSDHVHSERDIMPCDSITTQTVSQNLKNGIGSLVAEAIKAAGYTVDTQTADTISAYSGGRRVTWTKGIGLSVSSGSTIGNYNLVRDITRRYSAAAVSWAASRAGWTAKQTGDNTITLNRR